MNPPAPSSSSIVQTDGTTTTTTSSWNFSLEEICKYVELSENPPFVTGEDSLRLEEYLSTQLREEHLHILLNKINAVGLEALLSSYFGAILVEKITRVATKKSYNSVKKLIGDQLRGKIEKLVVRGWSKKNPYVVAEWIRCWRSEKEDGIFVFQELAAVSNFVGLCLAESFHVIHNAIMVNPTFFGPHCVNRIKGEVPSLYLSPRGNQILRTLLELCPQMVESVLSEIHSSLTTALRSSFGQNLVEHALKFCSSGTSIDRIIGKLLSDFSFYASRPHNRYLKALVERLATDGRLNELLSVLLVGCGNTSVVRETVNTLGREIPPTTPRLCCLMMHERGFSVAETVIEKSSTRQKEQIISQIQGFIPLVESSVIGCGGLSLLGQQRGEDDATWGLNPTMKAAVFDEGLLFVESNQPQQQQKYQQEILVPPLLSSATSGSSGVLQQGEVSLQSNIANDAGLLPFHPPIVPPLSTSNDIVAPPSSGTTEPSGTSGVKDLSSSSTSAPTPSSMVLMNDPVILARVTQKAVDTVETDIATIATRLRWVSPSMGTFQSTGSSNKKGGIDQQQQTSVGSHDLYGMYSGLLRAKVDLLDALAM